jgi:hypothetical protein
MTQSTGGNGFSYLRQTLITLNVAVGVELELHVKSPLFTVRRYALRTLLQGYDSQASPIPNGAHFALGLATVMWQCTAQPDFLPPECLIPPKPNESTAPAANFRFPPGLRVTPSDAGAEPMSILGLRAVITLRRKNHTVRHSRTFRTKPTARPVNLPRY